MRRMNVRPFRRIRDELANLPTQGSGKVVLVEFSDFECPFCRRHATQYSRIAEAVADNREDQVRFRKQSLVQHPKR